MSRSEKLFTSSVIFGFLMIGLFLVVEINLLMHSIVSPFPAAAMVQR